MKEKSVAADNTGIVSAILCTIHCLIIPVLFLAKFWLTGNRPEHILPPWWHQLDYLFLGISLWAVYHSASHTKAKKIRASLWIFWSMLAIAILFEDTLHRMAYIASAGLIGTHLRNIMTIKKLRKQTNFSMLAGD
jgi:hypothetical protein